MSSKSRTGSPKTDTIPLNVTSEASPSLVAMLFGRVPEEDITQYQKQELQQATALAVKALQGQKAGQCPITINHNAVTRNGAKLTVITLVSDNRPFLFDSVMGEIAAVTTDIYLVTHPVVNVATLNGAPAITLATADMPADKRRVSLMQIHVKALNKAQSDELRSGLENVAGQVSAATRDWKPMLAYLSGIMAQYHGNPPAGREKDAARVADFLGWLMDDHFLFLGMREYAFRAGESEAKAVRPQHGINLGILADSPGQALREPGMEETPQDALSFMTGPDLMIVTKAKAHSRVHRRVRLDYIGIKLFEYDGTLKGELRIFGLFTTTAYSSPLMRIPYLRPKVEKVIHRLGFSLSDHAGRTLVNILESYPRDELFRMDVESLAKNAGKILALTQRPRIRVLVDEEPFGHFVSVLVFVPRDRYDSTVREKIGHYLLEAFKGKSFDFSPMLLNTGLTRVHYVIHRQEGKGQTVGQAVLEAAVTKIVSNWEDQVGAAAAQEQANPQITALATSFPEAYRDNFNASTALHDAENVATLSAEKALHIEFYNQPEEDRNAIYLKLFHRNTALKLSQRVPLLENMGFRVIAEQTLGLPDGSGGTVYLHNMALENAYGSNIDLAKSGELLAEAFEAIWVGNADDDVFNSLTQAAGLDWRKIVILRSYGRYLQQVGVPYSQATLARTLSRYPVLARSLYEMFRLKFDPACQKEDAAKAREKISGQIETALQSVPSLDDDRIIHAFHSLVAASLRTNAFLPEEDGRQRRTLAIKFDPQKIEILPQPRPYSEVFVYGPEVEGVYMRFGAIARGGVCWSDRRQDYRAETLGLCRAQQLRNTVVVPSGARGGFYPHDLPQTTDRAALVEAARHAYSLYISAILSITDNMRDNKVIPAEGILRYDDNDPYFVVAAGRGTGSFTDTANAISRAHGFWLDDAFSAGDAHGYDHKKTGIAAKGAWEVVKRHFRETGRDIQTVPFTVAGIGNMSNDMFGNGMLLSRKTRLVAAFDQQDIFIDPNPKTEAAYEERKRLFGLPHSSWQDYDRSKISAGGGVFSRSQRTIALSPEAAKAIGFERQSGTPAEIIRAILKAEVDLLWFGGVGTYVRASHESDAQVGDRANDAVRIAGEDIRAGVIGEAASFGMTRSGRIEYALRGGRCNMDAVDNAAGVNCSDLEVNIKIALAAAMRGNKLTQEERNKLLKKMTPDVSGLVLRNNYLQSLALSLAELRAARELPYQIRFMNDLERRKLLDCRAEGLPDNQTLAERQARGQGLTRPELAVLMAYAKNMLVQEIITSPLIKDPYLDKILFGYFPAEMQQAFSSEIAGHPLRNNIVATALANDVINRVGVTYVAQLQDKTGQSVETIIRAYILVRDGFALLPLCEEIDALDNKVSGAVQNRFYAAVSRMLFETTGWILRNIQLHRPLEGQVAAIMKARQTIEVQLHQLIPDYLRQEIDNQIAAYKDRGAPDTLAHQLAMLQTAAIIPEIALVARKAGSELLSTAETHFAVAETFRINRIAEAGRNIPIADYYDGMALARANDTISEAMRRVVVQVMHRFKSDKNPVEAWLKADEAQITDVIQQMNTLIGSDLTVSRYTIAAGMISDLAKSEN